MNAAAALLAAALVALAILAWTAPTVPTASAADVAECRAAAHPKACLKARRRTVVYSLR